MEQQDEKTDMHGTCAPCFMSKDQDCKVCAYKLKHFKEAVATCANREAVFINGQVERKWWKNHPISIEDRVHPLDHDRMDWRVFDPQDCIG